MIDEEEWEDEEDVFELDHRHAVTGQVVEIRGVERCCNSCKYNALGQDGWGDCKILIDYKNGKPYMIEGYDPRSRDLRMEVSRASIGPACVCDFWEQEEDESDQETPIQEG